MNYIIMVAAMRYNEADGISKKICLQACALSFGGDQASLLCFGKNGILKINYLNGELIDKEELCNYIDNSESNSVICDIRHIALLLDSLKKLIVKDKPYSIYIRHMIPQFKLISVLNYASKHNIKILYEIPTYPYYQEQMNVSRNKVKTFIKLSIETFFWPLIYINIDRLCVICCNSNAHFYKKMISIKNGFSGEKHKYIKRDTDNLDMIGVGTIYSYHGYDRIIYAMKACNCKLESGGSVNFHIVGQSEEINKLKELVEHLGLVDNVHFYGVQYGQSLNNIYYKCNLGIGTMALNRRGANIDTAIKNIEYLSYYLPVISSGKIFDIDPIENRYMVFIENEEIRINEIYSFVCQVYADNFFESSVSKLLCSFEWRTIMEQLKKTC